MDWHASARLSENRSACNTHTVCVWADVWASVTREKLASTHRPSARLSPYVRSVKIYASPAKVYQFVENLQYCFVPRCSVTFWTYPEIIPVGQVFRRWCFVLCPFGWLIDWRQLNFDLIGLLDSYRTICFYGGGAKVTEHRGTKQYIWWRCHCRKLINFTFVKRRSVVVGEANFRRLLTRSASEITGTYLLPFFRSMVPQYFVSKKLLTMKVCWLNNRGDKNKAKTLFKKRNRWFVMK